ncbi:MAG: nucleotidyltransferase domain-containing protein [Crocosphaera sp.]|nr:nucleotidyltransferase domain-containing protein [Crocosphaera sp.]
MNLPINTILDNVGKHKKLEEILEQVKQQFKEIYQQDLVKLILFGSQARGEATRESDIDILVILKTAKSSQEKHKKTIEFISNLCIEYGILVSCIYVSEKQFNSEKSPLLLNIHREGIII